VDCVHAYKFILTVGGIARVCSSL